MPEDEQTDLTETLTAIRDGDRHAAADLVPLVYGHLRRLAQQQMNEEAPGHTLSATALVHEAYVRLVSDQDPGWDTRGHFFAAAAEAMRRILVERARRKRTPKHGGDRQRVPLGDVVIECDLDDHDLLALNAALDRLKDQDPRAYGIVMLRYFGGLTIPQIAEVIAMAPRSVDREWRCARLWLYEQVAEEARNAGPEAP